MEVETRLARTYRGFEISGSHIPVGGAQNRPLAALQRASGRMLVDLISAAATENYSYVSNKTKINIWACTDDGTCGFCGFGTELAQKVLENVSYDMIVTCGPEIMMKKIADLADYHKIPAQFSLERYMKCGVGICGQCCVDNVGWRICKEGPVFWDDEVKLITEFGKYHRDAAGRKELF